MISNRRILATTAHLVCVALYLWSLTLPALGFAYSGFDQTGLDVLATGWLGILVFDPRWYANIAFAFCLVSSAFGVGRRIAPLIGACLIIATLILPIYGYPQDHAVRVTQPGPAVLVWAIALMGVFLASFFTPVPKRVLDSKEPARITRT